MDCTLTVNRAMDSDRPYGNQCLSSSGGSEIQRPLTMRLGDLLFPKSQSERRPVPIRPPPLPPAAPVLAHSLVCAPILKPIIRRRARSLPSLSDRGQDPERRLQVRFVDSLGLDLADVRVYQVGEDPPVPQHVLSRLVMSSEVASGKQMEISLPYFTPTFPVRQCELPNFGERLRRQKVCLEEVFCSEMGIVGTARVIDLAFEKSVSARYSFTGWKSSADILACWVSTEDTEPRCDVFRFRLPVPPFIVLPGAMLEFAICYRVDGREYWDNNNGNNYKLMCQSYKLTVPHESEDSMVHFI